MSSALFSLSGAPSVQSSAQPAERDNNPQTPAAGSFGEALSRASQPADESVPKTSGKASHATTTATATTTRRSGKSEDEPDKPDPTDLVANLALMIFNSRNSLPVASNADAGGEPTEEPATASRKSVDTDLDTSLELTASGSVVVSTSLDSRALQSAVTNPLKPNLESVSSLRQTAAVLAGSIDREQGRLATSARQEANIPVTTSAVAASLGSRALQPAGTNPLMLNLENVSSPAQAAAALGSTATGLVASADMQSKPTAGPAVLTVLTSPVGIERGHHATSARQEANISVASSDVAAALDSRALEPIGTDPLALNLDNMSSPVQAVAVLASPVGRQQDRPALSARSEVNTPATTSGKAQMADPRVTADPAAFIPPAQNSPGLLPAGVAGVNARPEKVAFTQTRTTGLSAQADVQADAQAQFEVLASSQSISRFAGPDGNAAADLAAAPSMMSSAVPIPARFDVATGTMTSSIAGTTNGIAPILPQNVGSTDWGTALGQHVMHMSRNGQETAELQLNPPGLGPLKVSLSMNEHQIQAAFVSTHASVRAAVEAALPQLRAAMADGGISLGETSVGSQSQQAADTRQGQEDRPSPRGQPDSPHRELAGAAQRATTQPRTRVNGAGVDIYA